MSHDLGNTEENKLSSFNVDRYMYIEYIQYISDCSNVEDFPGIYSSSFYITIRVSFEKT